MLELELIDVLLHRFACDFKIASEIFERTLDGVLGAVLLDVTRFVLAQDLQPTLVAANCFELSVVVNVAVHRLSGDQQF